MLSQGPGQFKYFPTVWSGLWYLHIYRPRPSTAASSVNGPIIFINGFTPAQNLNWPWLTIRWLIITFIHVTNWMDIFQQIAPFTHYQCFIINQPNHLQCWLLVLPESQKKNDSCKKYFVNSPHRLTPAWEGQDDLIRTIQSSGSSSHFFLEFWIYQLHGKFHCEITNNDF